MKLTAIVLLSACLAASASGHSQNVSLTLKDAPLEKVFSEIRKQTGYSIFCNYRLLENAKPVTINVKDATVDEVLKTCLKDQLLGYEIADKSIVIIAKAAITIEEPLAPPPITVRGRVLNEKGEPVAASVLVKGTKNGTSTNADGFFELKDVAENATLVISGVNIETYEIKVSGKSDLTTINVKTKIAVGEGVTVNTGYQTLKANEVTGSFEKIDNKLLNRTVGSNILSRLEGMSGVLFTKPGTTTGNESGFVIRGRSTLFANAQPLIVLDNFPYSGDINNINPNDIESITILKDAAATSIWGAFAGNGVIVITSKKAKLNSKLSIEFNSNLTVTGKPNFTQPQLTSKEFSEIERFVFDKGQYDLYLTFGPEYPQSSVVDILEKERNGLISPADAQNQINAIASHDVRNDLKKYFYRKSVDQQHAINLRGGGPRNIYMFSVGFDKSLASYISDSRQRLTITANNTYYLLKNNKLELTTGVRFVNSTDRTNSKKYNPRSPYDKVADANGNILATVKDYRQGYVDTVGQGLLLDWKYRPLDERRPNQNNNITDYRFNAGVNYHFTKFLSLSAAYEYSKAIIDFSETNEANSYFTRNTINQFTNINYANLTVIRPVPLGQILGLASGGYDNHVFRGQLNFNKTFANRHTVSVLAGYEARDNHKKSNYRVLYGYDPSTARDQQIDYFRDYPTIPVSMGGVSRVGYIHQQSFSDDRFISKFANASYIYDRRYSISFSARKDESNLFGAKSNERGVPLWSAGAGWTISNENFYKIFWLPFLKLRVTDGYSGNIDKNIAAFVTTQVSPYLGTFNLPYLNLVNPPNPGLRWEKVNTKNVALDFALKNEKLSGSVEYYIKKGSDLIGNSPIAPQTGIIQFRGNNSNVTTKGFEISLNGNFAFNKIKWNPSFILTHTKDVVTKYAIKNSSVQYYILQNSQNPFEGKPYNSVFSYAWAGLDTLGDPQGYFNGAVSKNYAEILNSADPNLLTFHGSGTPTIFGSFRNDFSYKSFSLSLNIMYKLGYFFRDYALSYDGLFNGNYLQKGFSERWQGKGDELTTHVPSIRYPVTPGRDQFYSYSSVHVMKADHIRLNDIRLSYEVLNRTIFKTPISSLRLYALVSNLGVLWRANDRGIDPDNIIGIRPSRSFSIGVNANL